MSSNKKQFYNNRKKKHFNKPNQPKPPREYRYKDQLAETDVGITEYLTEGEGFSGIIKARYSDFQVNEIDLQGNLAKLTDMSCPEEFDSNLKCNSTNSYKETEKSPVEFIPQDKWEAMKTLAEEESADPVYIDVEELDKSARREIHNIIGKYFIKTLISTTKEIDGKKVVEFKKFTKAANQDLRLTWPNNLGKYVYFLLYKEDMDTMEAISRISRMLRMKIGNFAYAGVKDKRSKSTQWISVKKVSPEKLLSCTKHVWLIKTGNFSFRHTPLKLGQLKGNKFRIALRNVTAGDDVVNTAMEAVKNSGFINYYGLQRFGNDKEVTTFDIGIQLLLGNWKEAVGLILKPKQHDDPASDVLKAKKIYLETGDANKALAVLKKRKSVEELLLEGLARGDSNDYVNALENIPRNMRLMYLHSVQSLIWNRMVSKRIKLFGLQPIVGDLVIVDSDKLIEDTPKDAVDSDNSDMDDDCDEKIDKAESTKNSSSTSASEEKEEIRCRVKVKALTNEDFNNYTIHDIVLPLPGYDVIYPEYMKEHYKEALEKFGLSLEMPKQKVKTYTLAGDYRNILVSINDLSWKTMLYNSPTDNLILSDLEELKGEKEPLSIKNGQYKALVLELSLPSSCYATMVLREILKTNTSSSSQAKLNDYHIDKQKKIIIDNENENQEDTSEELTTTIQSNSLLNPDKFEAFKNSILEDILGGTKRKNEEEGDSCSKIQKVDNSS